MASSLWIGVDIAKDTFDAALWRETKALDLGQFPNTQAGFALLAQQLAPFQPADQPLVLHVVLEPTGGYQLALIQFAHQRGWRFSQINPAQVRFWATGVGIRAKTDRQDARLLARYGQEMAPPPQDPLPTPVAHLEGLVDRRLQREATIRQERNRLGILEQDASANPWVLADLRAEIADQERKLAQVEAAIAHHLATHPELQEQVSLLHSVPGVGAKTVLPLLIHLHRWEAYTQGQGTTKGFVAYTGLDPRLYQSGTSVFRRSTISRQGNSRLRRFLYMAALGGVRGHNVLKDFYQRLVGRGKAKRLALVAAGRKILVWALAVFRSKAKFDPTRAQPAAPPAEAPAA